MTAIDRRAFVAYLLVCIVWGSTYLGIRVAVESLPPFLMAGVRFVVAGSILAAVVRWRGLAWPDGARGVAHVALCGVLLFLVGNGLVVWSLQFVPSGIASVYVVSVSGPKMYDVQQGRPFIPRSAAGAQLYQLIHIDGDQLRYEARLATGQLYDAFSLKKRNRQPNELIEQVPDTEELLRR